MIATEGMHPSVDLIGFNHQNSENQFITIMQVFGAVLFAYDINGNLTDIRADMIFP